MSVSVYIIGETVDDLLEWNVANGNWHRILELLGLDFADQDMWYGSWTGDTLQQVREKVAFALESVKALPELDGGIPDQELPRGPHECRIIIGGLSPWYFRMRLEGLLAIIDRGIAAGLPVRYS